MGTKCHVVLHQSQGDPAAKWVWTLVVVVGGRGCVSTEESAGIVGIEVPIILYT